MFCNLSIKYKLIGLLLLATVTITAMVSVSFGMLLDRVFYKDAQTKMDNALVHLAGDIRSTKQNLIDSTALVIHNLDIDLKLKSINNNHSSFLENERKDIAIQILDQLKYSSADEIYIYDLNHNVVAYAKKYMHTYLCGYQLNNNDTYSKHDGENEFKKTKLKPFYDKHLYKHNDPFSKLTTTSHYRIFDNKVNILSHREYISENKVIGSISLVKTVGQEHIDLLLKNFSTDMSLIIDDKGVETFKQKYQIDLKNDNIYIPPLFSHISNNLNVINKKNEFLSVVAIPADKDYIYIVSTIKKDFLDETSFANIKNLFLIVSLFSIFLITISVYIVNKIIGQPLNKILYNINLIEKGDYNLKKIEDRKDEIGKISHTVYLMANTIKSREKNLDDMIKIEVEKNRQKDQQLFQQSRLAQIGEMISMIAHQWRQPLAAISATNIDLQVKIELEEYNFEDKVHQEEFLTYVKGSITRIDTIVQSLATTIDDFRNFYKPNKKASLSTLEDVVRQSISIIKASLDASKITIIYDYKSVLSLKLYKNEMVQVLLNIFKNSQDNFIEKGIENPQINITVDKNIITICDNGGGVDEDIIDNIFDPYFSTKDEKNGTGIGLYMSKTIIDDHHKGDLSVENKDDGACFRVVVGDIN